MLSHLQVLGVDEEQKVGGAQQRKQNNRGANSFAYLDKIIRYQGSNGIRQWPIN